MYFFCWGLARGTSQCLLKEIYNMNDIKIFIPAGHTINIKCKGNLKVFFQCNGVKLKSKTRLSTSKFS